MCQALTEDNVVDSLFRKAVHNLRNGYVECPACDNAGDPYTIPCEYCDSSGHVSVFLFIKENFGKFKDYMEKET